MRISEARQNLHEGRWKDAVDWATKQIDGAKSKLDDFAGKINYHATGAAERPLTLVRDLANVMQNATKRGLIMEPEPKWDRADQSWHVITIPKGKFPTTYEEFAAMPEWKDDLKNWIARANGLGLKYDFKVKNVGGKCVLSIDPGDDRKTILGLYANKNNEDMSRDPSRPEHRANMTSEDLMDAMSSGQLKPADLTAEDLDKVAHGIPNKEAAITKVFGTLLDATHIRTFATAGDPTVILDGLRRVGQTDKDAFVRLGDVLDEKKAMAILTQLRPSKEALARIDARRSDKVKAIIQEVQEYVLLAHSASDPFARKKWDDKTFLANLKDGRLPIEELDEEDIDRALTLMKLTPPASITNIKDKLKFLTDHLNFTDIEKLNDEEVIGGLARGSFNGQTVISNLEAVIGHEAALRRVYTMIRSVGETPTSTDPVKLAAQLDAIGKARVKTVSGTITPTWFADLMKTLPTSMVDTIVSNYNDERKKAGKHPLSPEWYRNAINHFATQYATTNPTKPTNLPEVMNRKILGALRNYLARLP